MSDTRISAHGVALDRNQGRIKTVLLSPTLAVSFAGSPDLADRSLQNLKYSIDIKFNDIVKYFQNASSDGGVDYLLSFAGPPRFVRLSGGLRVDVGRHTWIGDQQSFGAFQDNVHSQHQSSRIIGLGLPNNIDLNIGRQIDSFLRVLERPHQIEVGDFMTALVSDRGRFHFVPIATLYFDPNTFLRGEKGELTAIATGENADFRFETLVPSDPGDHTAAFGFHFPKSEICYLYQSEGNDFPSFKCIYRQLEGDKLGSQLEADLGVRLAHLQMRHADDPPSFTQ